jgi:cell fate (sporulation/competence/biofilm development) regulator YlbF (YheA/YmcA/DUF963 family)
MEYSEKEIKEGTISNALITIFSRKQQKLRKFLMQGEKIEDRR